MASAYTNPVIFGTSTVDNTGSLDTNLVGASLGTFIYAGAAGGTANAISLTIPILPINDYYYGMVLRFLAASNNTGPVTLAVNGLAAQPLNDVDNAPLTANAIVAGRIIEVVFALPASGSAAFRLSGSGGGGGAVSSVFGRTGAVVAQANDYTIQQIGNVVISSTAPTGLPVNSIWLQTP